MKFFIIGIIVVLTALAAQAQPVWKATKGEATVYIGGTIHVLRPKDFPLSPAFDVAFAASKKIYFETDIARVNSPELQKIVMENAYYAGDNTLPQNISPEAWKALSAYASKNGIPRAQLARMKPWFVILMITAVELQKVGVTEEGVDMHYFKQVAAAGKQAGELETFEEHIIFLLTMGQGQESEMVENSINELEELPTLLDDMLRAWSTGDLEKIDELMLREAQEKYPLLYQSLLVDRNRAWLPKIEQLFATPETEFVLVGAGHLAGEEGLIAQLKARGFNVKPVKAPGP